jgi:hypothetical protein
MAEGEVQLVNEHLIKLQASILNYRDRLQPTPEDLSEYNLVLNQLDGVVKHSALLFEDFARIELQLQEEIREEEEEDATN